MKKFVFILLFIPFGLFAQINSPIALYKLDGTANDFSGNAYNGTAENVLYGLNQNGTVNSAAIFNGTSSKVMLPDDFDYNLRSINAWIYCDAFPTSASGNVYNSDHNNLSYGNSIIAVQNINGNNKIAFVQGGSVN